LRNNAFVLTVCALLALAAAPRAAFADDTLTVIGASTTAGFFEVLDHVAEREGFYKAEHLVVDKQYIMTASTVAQLVASGKADVASMSVEPVLQGYEHGLRLQYFFGTDPQYVYALGVLQNSPIHTLADFKGKDIGEINPGSAAEVAAQSMLGGAGLKKSDYSFVPIGTGAQALAAVVAGRVAGSALPAAALIMEGVEGHQTFRLFRHPILKDIGTYGFAALPATIAAKSDQLKRYCRALVEAGLLIRENPRVAARDFLLGAGIPVTGDALANETQVLTLAASDLPAANPANPRIGYMSPLGMQIYAQFLYDNGMSTQVAPSSIVVTNRFIAYANDFDKKAFIARVKALR
jgi:NitT/TauT family transport system substrate-binding protein